MSKPPAFSWYPKDYESDEHVKLMSLEQEGAYVRLLNHSWLHGSIPSDLRSLSQICRTTPAKMARLWPGILPCWNETTDEKSCKRFINSRLEREREAQRNRKSQASLKGHKGAEKRWRDDSSSYDPAKAQALPGDSIAFASAKRNKRIAETATTGKGGWVAEAAELWKVNMGGPKPHGEIGSHLKPLVDEHGWEVVRPVWQRYLSGETGQNVAFRRLKDFVERFGHWRAFKAKPQASTNAHIPYLEPPTEPEPGLMDKWEPGILSRQTN